MTTVLPAPMSSPSVRIVGPAALKALMAYGGTVHDLRTEREPAGSGNAAEGVEAERVAGRVAGSGAEPDDLILLLADDLDASSRVAARLQLDGYSCVVVVNAGPAPADAAPAGTPG